MSSINMCRRENVLLKPQCPEEQKQSKHRGLGPPHDAALQAPGDHVDGHALRLVGEGHGADALSAVHMSHEVPVDRPESEVAASAS